MNENEAFSINPEERDFGERLDFFIATRLENQSRKKITELIKDGFITVSGEMKKPSYKVKPGDNINGSIPFKKPVKAIAENIDIDVIYQDQDIIVINKQPDFVVHPAPGNYTGTLVNALLHHFPELQRDDNDLRPGIVHRLDKDTSGVMIVAKTNVAQMKLSYDFKERFVSKSYLAIVHGKPEQEGVIEAGIGRHQTDRKKMSVISRYKRDALTRYKVLEQNDLAALIECNIETGRTHQIRVHCAHINHHILGDPVYGLQKKERNEPYRTILKGVCRQMLHAYILKFNHPLTGKSMEFTVEPPGDMQGVMERIKC